VFNLDHIALFVDAKYDHFILELLAVYEGIQPFAEIITKGLQDVSRLFQEISKVIFPFFRGVFFFFEQQFGPTIEPTFRARHSFPLNNRGEGN